MVVFFQPSSFTTAEICFFRHLFKESFKCWKTNWKTQLPETLTLLLSKERAGTHLPVAVFWPQIPSAGEAPHRVRPDRTPSNPLSPGPDAPGPQPLSSRPPPGVPALAPDSLPLCPPLRQGCAARPAAQPLKGACWLGGGGPRAVCPQHRCRAPGTPPGADALREAMPAPPRRC